MELSSYSSFLILTFTIVFSPGPMTMFMMASGMKMQYKKVWPILIGASNAYLLSIIIFSLGLTKLLQEHDYLFKAIQLAGIIYLISMARKQWSKPVATNLTNSELAKLKPSKLYLKGALIAFSNPKTLVLFAAVFPQFFTGPGRLINDVCILGSTFLFLQLSSGLAYAYFGKKISNLLKQEKHQVYINRLAASILLMVALLLIMRLF